MTREEAIRLIGWLKCTTNREDDLEAIDMAIESLSQPIVAKHFDIESGYIYCSPQIAENVKVVVRCKDCRYAQYDATHYFCAEHHHKVYEDDYCSHGQRLSNFGERAEQTEKGGDEMTAEVCGDNRFEIIERAKTALLESTNIDTAEDEMKVLDNFLFRCWQMGWLDKYDDTKGRPHGEWLDTHEDGHNYWVGTCSICHKYSRVVGNFCPNCGTSMRSKESDTE